MIFKAIEMDAVTAGKIQTVERGLESLGPNSGVIRETNTKLRR